MRSTQYAQSQYGLTPPVGPTSNPAPRQTMWSQVLDPSHASGGAHPETHNPLLPVPPPAPPSQQGRGGNDLFVQLDPPAGHLTTVFTPHGLLSAGMADRQDRSAKRQEEMARESGASLINVPNKPPPPQTGLLGAITGYERERKREGGVGAALTEREREKRVAEERQRRWDEQQRMQMEQGGMGGGMGAMGMNPMMSMYGGQFNPMMSMYGMNGMNPMNPMMSMYGMQGMNPMMTGGAGLSPMMTGGGGMNPMAPMMSGNGMNPMMNPMAPMMTGMSGMGMQNPQHMFAAQQAAQAYQQAMMAFFGCWVSGGWR
ncbi:hypothetical protein BDP27DRAFT_650540 [Rhodocollybia butyracea]|uniref:Uncharacterized protein n=1 Tax=Rhodocollybia butyracea TaxID=206335 RepID=A0A9P5P8Y4_9AGAR|nr:hypothetical protein BDP27DRAFT_650540 [Rhodocollybia butyracea]